MNVTHERVEESTVEWYTPRNIINALITDPRKAPFDLDPCAAPVHFRNKLPLLASTSWNPTDPENPWTFRYDGLQKEWGPEETSVWLNPPYGRGMDVWLEKMAKHSNGIALIFARTDTKAFQEYIWGKASAIFFIKGRVKFLTPKDGILTETGPAGAPSVLIAFDNEHSAGANAEKLKRLALPGHFVDLSPSEVIWHGWKQLVRSILEAEGSLTLKDMYARVELIVNRPTNNNVRAKVRQVLNTNDGILFSWDSSTKLWSLFEKP